MTEGFIRHFISFLGTLIIFLVWMSAYFSGVRGWWFFFFVPLLFYFIIYKLLEV